MKNGKCTTALQGKYQNPWAPFGYVKSAQQRSRLEVAPEAAGVVRRIFKLFLEGRGTVEVARILNHDGVPTKSAYRAAQGDIMRWHYGKSDRPLAGKIKCGICGHAMPLIKGEEPYFTCGTKWYDSDYSCGDFQVSQVELYEVLMAALRHQIDLQVEQEDLRREH